MSKQLKDKPLVEAVLDVHWELSPGIGPETDPHYKLLLGRFYDRVQDDYPAHEQLPTADLPDALVAHKVQHRFRVGKDRWPLVQLGPGVLAVNSTADYDWDDFRERCLEGFRTLYDAHPKPDQLKIKELILRYIDAVSFDYSKDDALEFLRRCLKVELALPDNLLQGKGVREKPLSFNWQFTFPCEEPAGSVTMKFEVTSLLVCHESNFRCVRSQLCRKPAHTNRGLGGKWPRKVSPSLRCFPYALLPPSW